MDPNELLVPYLGWLWLRYDNKYATQGSVLPVTLMVCLISIYGNWVLCHPPTEMVFVALNGGFPFPPLLDVLKQAMGVISDQGTVS